MFEWVVKKFNPNILFSYKDFPSKNDPFILLFQQNI